MLEHWNSDNNCSLYWFFIDFKQLLRLEYLVLRLKIYLSADRVEIKSDRWVCLPPPNIKARSLDGIQNLLILAYISLLRYGTCLYQKCENHLIIICECHDSKLPNFLPFPVKLSLSRHLAFGRHHSLYILTKIKPWKSNAVIKIVLFYIFVN